MGLFDTLLGRTKPVRANLDALFALPSAAVTLEASAGLVPSGQAWICWKPPAGKAVSDIEAEIGELLALPDDSPEGLTSDSTSSAAAVSNIGQIDRAEDSYGYQWIMLSDPDIADLVTRVHLVNSTLSDAGWGPQLLCSVFGLVPDPGNSTSAGSSAIRAMYLVYLFKRGTFYPFVPDGHEHRDTELELRIRATLGVDLPTETDVSRWFPLWDIPSRPDHSGAQT